MIHQSRLNLFAVLATAEVLLAVSSGIQGADHNTSIPGRILTDDHKINDDAGTANQFAPSLAMHKHGPAVAAWPDGRNGGSDIYFQLFNRRGQPFRLARERQGERRGAYGSV